MLILLWLKKNVQNIEISSTGSELTLRWNPKRKTSKQTYWKMIFLYLDYMQPTFSLEHTQINILEKFYCFFLHKFSPSQSRNLIRNKGTPIMQP